MCPEMQSSGQRKIHSDLRRAEIEYASCERIYLYSRQVVKTRDSEPSESFQTGGAKVLCS